MVGAGMGVSWLMGSRGQCLNGRVGGRVPDRRLLHPGRSLSRRIFLHNMLPEPFFQLVNIVTFSAY